MIDPTFFTGVTTGPIGVQNFISNFDADNQTVAVGGPAYPLYKRLVLAQVEQGQGSEQLPGPADGEWHGAPLRRDQPGGPRHGDVALDGGRQVQGGHLEDRRGRSRRGQGVLVRQGVKALKAGKKIVYQGVGGHYQFDSYQTAFGPFEDDQYKADGTTVAVGASLGFCNLTLCKAKL